MATSKAMAILGATATGTVIAALGVVAALRSAEEPDFNEAKAFLIEYYDAAPKQPDETWGRLTESYRSRALAKGFDDYHAYWTTFRSVQITEVDSSTQTPGWWTARLDFTKRDLARSHTYFQFDLRCPERTTWPLIECDAGDVKINAVKYLDKEHWPE